MSLIKVRRLKADGVQHGGKAIAPAAFLDGGGLLEGSSAAAIANQGTISAGGDVVLIGRLVENSGSLTAGGDARLVSAERLVLREAGSDGRVHVEIADGTAGDGGGAVRNSGRVEAAAAELRAVGGNVYALAADTSGVRRLISRVTAEVVSTSDGMTSVAFTAAPLQLRRRTGTCSSFASVPAAHSRPKSYDQHHLTEDVSVGATPSRP